MQQTGQMIDALKRSLRARGLTYRDVAEALDLSEATIKRLFSARSFTLSRLEEICHLLEMSIYDLAKLTAMAEERETTLSLAQEQALADDAALLAYFYLLINGRQPAQIARDQGLDERTSLRVLLRLDRLKLIELQPGNHARLRTARKIGWRKGGPVRRRYERDIKQLFMKGTFDDSDELLRFESAELSEASVKIVRRRLEKLAQEFNELAELDLRQPRKLKRGIGLMLALRAWTFWQVIGAAPH